MITERYEIHSVTAYPADYVAVLVFHGKREEDKLPKLVLVTLDLQEDAAVFVNGVSASWHYLIGWVMETKNVMVEVDRDEARYGFITEARFTGGSTS